MHRQLGAPESNGTSGTTGSSAAKPHGARRALACVPGQVPGILAEAAAVLAEVSRRYVFRANDYYLRLIDWDDPQDPTWQLVIPRLEELESFGALDEQRSGQHGRPRCATQGFGTPRSSWSTASVGPTAATASASVRSDDNDESTHDLGPAFTWLHAAHPEITDAPDGRRSSHHEHAVKLRGIVERFAAMPHVRTIRLGLKMPAFNPFRILEDKDLQALFRGALDRGPRDLSDGPLRPSARSPPEAREGLICARENHARVVNQCPVIRGINDDPEILAELSRA
ncbi:MAG: hypothetical protein R3E12_03185 [Candidatus Eisenbacteria bacterium]